MIAEYMPPPYALAGARETRGDHRVNPDKCPPDICLPGQMSPGTNVCWNRHTETLPVSICQIFTPSPTAQ